MTNDLEDRLSAMLMRRAEDIRTTPTIDFSPIGKSRTRLSLGPYAVVAAVAAVVLVAGGTVVGIRSIHHPSPMDSAASQVIAPTVAHTATPMPSTCQKTRAGASWNSAIGKGTRVVLDHPANSVVSVNSSTGEYLLLQATPSTGQEAAIYSQATLAIFKGTTGQDVAVLPTGSTDLPVVDPAGAITADWIAYGFAPPQNGGTYYKVMLYNRHTHTTITVAQLSDSALQSGRILSAPPIILNGKLYWISSIYSDRSKSKLESYDLQTRARTATPAPGATALVYYGTGVASVTGYDSNSTFSTKLGTQLPSRVVQALQGATAFTYNAPSAGSAGSGVLHWTRSIALHGEGGTAYYSYAVGDAGLSYTESTDEAYELTVSTDPFVPATPIAGGSGGVVDGRQPFTGIHALPEGDVLQATVGDTAIFGTGSNKFGSSSLVLVKISALPHDIASC